MNNERRGFLKALALLPVCGLGAFSSRRKRAVGKLTIDDKEFEVTEWKIKEEKNGCNYIVNLEDGTVFRYPKRYGIPNGCCTLKAFIHIKKGFLSPNEARKLNKKYIQ